MIKSVEALGERLLSLVVPRTTASAGCPPDPWKQSCGCSGHRIRYKNCRITPACKVSCGSCIATDISC